MATIEELIELIQSEAIRGGQVMPIVGPTDGKTPPGWTIQEIRDGLEMLLANYSVVTGAVSDAVNAASEASDAAAEASQSAEEVASIITPALLTEDGNLILQEDDSRLLQEFVVYSFDFPAYAGELPPAAALTGSEEVIVSVTGVPQKSSPSAIVDYAIDSARVARRVHYHPSSDAREADARVFGTTVVDDDGFAGHIVLNNANPNYYASGADLGGRIRVATANGFVDCSGIPANIGEVTFDVQTGSACVLYAGYGGDVWRNTGGTKLLAPGGSIVKVMRGQSGELMAYAVLGGPLTSSVVATPAYNDVWGWSGQSWAQRSQQAGWGGIQSQRVLLGLNRWVLSLQNIGRGASSMLKGGASLADNYWWDQDLNVPGPNLDNSVATILAALAANPGAPPLSTIFMHLGANDFPAFQPTGAATPAVMTAAYNSVAAHYRSALSLPNLKYFIIPMCSVDRAIGGASENAFYAERFAQLDAVPLNANNFRGADVYDIPHPWADYIHHYYQGMAEHGARMAQFVARANGANVYLGPKITGFARLAPRSFQFTINRWGGFPTLGLNPEPIQKPEQPLGFAVLPNNDLFATPLVITDYEWSGDNLIVTTATDDVNAIGAYPWGQMSTASVEPTRIVRCRDRDTGVTFPLMTYHPNPAI